MSQVAGLISLPADVLQLIYCTCSVITILRGAEVCKRFREMLRANGVWSRHVHRMVTSFPSLQVLFDKYAGHSSNTHKKIATRKSRAKYLKRELGIMPKGHWYVFHRFLIAPARVAKLYFTQKRLAKKDVQSIALLEACVQTMFFHGQSMVKLESVTVSDLGIYIHLNIAAHTVPISLFLSKSSGIYRSSHPVGIVVRFVNNNVHLSSSDDRMDTKMTLALHHFTRETQPPFYGLLKWGYNT